MSRLLVVFALMTTLVAADAVARQSSGFFRTDGKRVLDGNGNPGMIRGIGLGGWLMPEGYMIHFPREGSFRNMKREVNLLIGETDGARFWELYRENYVEEKDIAALAEAGFDHVRLPFHYEVVYDIDTGTMKPEGLALLDTFVEWCRTHGLYVILDLHATPGAQNEGEISDSDGTARLWTQPVPYQNMTIFLWAELARHYANETQIIGYDLINEPVTPESVPDGAGELRSLYERLVLAVRSVDTNHIVFIEGNYWATTFDKLTPPFDDNMVYAFHKYWNATDIGTIWYLLNIRDTYNVPLWLGESGENSNSWFHEVVSLMEQQQIGWNWWTHKKVQSTTAPWAAFIKPGYRAVLDYWAGRSGKPSTSAARDALFEMARGLDMDSTRFDPGVLTALFDPDFGTGRSPYVDLVLPGVVNAADYDNGMPEVTYSDVDVAATSGSPGGGNRGAHYRNDGVDIEASTDRDGYAYNVGFLEPGEWMEYTVRIRTSGTYNIDVRVASVPGGGNLEVSMDGVPIGSVTVPRTGGWQAWTSLPIESVHLFSGVHVMRLTVGAVGDFNLNRLTFDLVESDDPENPTPVERPEVFPNPATDAVSIQLLADDPGTAVLTLYDTLGRERFGKSWQIDPGINNLTLDVSGLAAAAYHYRLQVGSSSFSGKLVVVR